MFFEKPGAFRAAGELAHRMSLSRARLSEPLYAAPQSFEASADWPGDWPGRTILAQILLARATGEAPAPLDANLRALRGRLNARGYLGDIHPYADEQQLSGHNWFLRALCEWYEWRKEPEVLEMAKRVAENLFLPLRALYEAYPLSQAERPRGAGAESGTLTGAASGGWALSTDIGCAFIPTDGLTRLYGLAPSPELAALIRTMIGVFKRADLTGESFQTHATLSCARGVLQFAEDTGDAEAAAFARELFDFYWANGRTENFANQNWFGRPLWTEPCAVADSYLLAMGLWAATGETDYLEKAQLIYYNALCFGQRENGGFGCDECAGEWVAPHSEGSYEASWCCTMRGGATLARVAQYAWARDAEGLILATPFPGSLRTEAGTIVTETGYPEGDGLTVTADHDTQVRVYIPGWIDRPDAGGYADVPLYKNIPAHIDMKPKEYEAPALRAGWHTKRRGVLLIARDGERESYLTRSTFTDRAAILATKWRVIYPD